MLTILDSLPAAILECEAAQLHDHLAGPTLIHLPGRRQRPLFVSVLLHGNEDTGWRAIRNILRAYQQRELPRALSLLIGNVQAARHGLRHLDDQPDYNRVWQAGDSVEHTAMRQVLEQMRQREVFASVDVHNNTGLNPHYACVNRLDNQFLQLATLFSRTVVYFIKPDSVQSLAFAGMCPAVTVECGQPSQAHGVEHAQQYLEACLHLEHLSEHAIAAADINLFHTMAIVKVPAGTTFGFDDDTVEIRFAGDIDQLNFSELPANTLIGWRQPASQARLQAWNESGHDVGDRYFNYENNEIRLAIPVMPSMLTLDARIIGQDCLCYLMERMTLESTD